MNLFETLGEITRPDIEAIQAQKLELIKERVTELPGVLQAFEMAIKNGEINPLTLLILTSSMDKYVKHIKEDKELQEIMLKEHSRSGDKSVSFNGVKITVNEKATYDYTPCQDARLESLTQEIAYLTEQKKAIELELQARYKHDDFVNPISGEIIEVIKPLKTSTTYFSVKF